MFENRVLSGVFWPQREYVTGDGGKLHVEELCDSYSPPNIRAIKMRTRWAGHVARTE
jgi:hypothetical protein